MKKKLRADLILLVITAFWGISFPLMRNVLEHMHALSYIAARFILSAFFVSLFFVDRHKKIGKGEIKGGVVIGALLAVGMLLQIFGLYSTTASNSAFITSMSVVFVPILLALFFKSRTNKFTTIGIISAAAGLFLISGAVTLDFNNGDLLTLLCAVAFALQIIFIDRKTKKADPGAIAIVQIWTAALMVSVVWLIFNPGPITINPQVVLILVITSLFGTSFAFSAQILVQKDTTPAATALIFTMEPLFALFFALIIPDGGGKTETLTAINATGAVLILFGTLISEYKTISGFREKRKSGSRSTEQKAYEPEG